MKNFSIVSNPDYHKTNWAHVVIDHNRDYRASFRTKDEAESYIRAAEAELKGRKKSIIDGVRHLIRDNNNKSIDGDIRDISKLEEELVDEIRSTIIKNYDNYQQGLEKAVRQLLSDLNNLQDF